MGYYTHYEFETQNNKYKIGDILDYMLLKNKEASWFYPFEGDMKELKLYGKINDELDFELGVNDEAKWYEHNEEMRELSKNFPETIFCLNGEGEESGDIWRTYYKNGKQQDCTVKIEFDDFDESKLR